VPLGWLRSCFSCNLWKIFPGCNWSPCLRCSICGSVATWRPLSVPTTPCFCPTALSLTSCGRNGRRRTPWVGTTHFVWRHGSVELPVYDVAYFILIKRRLMHIHCFGDECKVSRTTHFLFKFFLKELLTVTSSDVIIDADASIHNDP